METGTYHKYNYLKFKVFKVLYNVYPKSLTSIEIADAAEVEKEKVSMMLGHYQKFGYVGRRKSNEPETNRFIYKYKLNILGISTYLSLLALYNQGRELNLRKMQRGKLPERIDSYMGKTKAFAEKEMREAQQEDTLIS